MKFREVKYAKQFVARGLGISAIKPEQVDEVMECEIHLIGGDPDSANPFRICSWLFSGIAGQMLDKIFSHDESWRATDSPTPCQSCEALKARVKELEEEVKNNNTLVQKAFAMLDKKTLIFAIMGCGFKCTTTAENMEKLGLAEFCGNQHNPEWRWIKSKLEALSESELSMLLEINSKK